MLLHCVYYMYLLPSLSQSYVFGIKAIVNITKGTCLCLRAKWKVISTTMADSTQGMAQSSLLGEMSSAAAEIELLAQGDTGAAQPVERGPAWGNLSFWGYFPAWRCCLEMGKFRQYSGAAHSNSCGMCRGSGESSPGWQCEPWSNIFY